MHISTKPVSDAAMIKEAVELHTTNIDMLTAIMDADDLLNDVQSFVETYEAAFEAVFEPGSYDTSDRCSTVSTDSTPVRLPKFTTDWKARGIHEINW